MKLNAHIIYSIKKVFALIILFIISSSAFADGHITTIQKGPCTITIIAVDKYFRGNSPMISGSLDTEQSRADVKKVKDALEYALSESPDMNTKVDSACNNLSNNIEIWVYRGSSEVDYAYANSGRGVIGIDMGDVDNMKEQLSGNSQDAINTVASAELTRILAHEFDHLRDKPGESHADPSAEEAALKTGPAVDDENAVISEMDFPFHERKYYTVIFEDGFGTSYWVDTDGDGLGDTMVYWLFLNVIRIDGESSSHILSEVFNEIPTQWDPIINTDHDLDGVLDEIDNCPNLVNPQQGSDCD